MAARHKKRVLIAKREKGGLQGGQGDLLCVNTIYICMNASICMHTERESEYIYERVYGERQREKKRERARDKERER